MREKKEIIREILKMKKKGMSLRAIATKLNDSGVIAKRGGINCARNPCSEHEGWLEKETLDCLLLAPLANQIQGRHLLGTNISLHKG